MKMEDLAKTLAGFTKNEIATVNDCLYARADCDPLYGGVLKIEDCRTNPPPEPALIPEDSFCHPMNKENAALLVHLTAAWLFWTKEDVETLARSLSQYQLHLKWLETIQIWHSV